LDECYGLRLWLLTRYEEGMAVVAVVVVDVMYTLGLLLDEVLMVEVGVVAFAAVAVGDTWHRDHVVMAVVVGSILLVVGAVVIVEDNYESGVNFVLSIGHQLDLIDTAIAAKSPLLDPFFVNTLFLKKINRSLLSLSQMLRFLNFVITV